MSDAWDWCLLAALVVVVGLVAHWLVRNAGPARRAFDWCLLALVVGVVGFIASWPMDGLSHAYRAYGEAPIPGSARLHLPAGDVVVTFRAEVGQDEEPAIPENIEPVINAPSGVPQPSVTKDLGGTFSITGTPGITSEARRRVMVAHIPVAGYYTVTTYGMDGLPVNPRLSFGHASLFRFLMWPFVGLTVVSLVACAITFPRREPDGGPVVSDGDLLASGQRVRGVLKSFAKAEAATPRRGSTPSRPELLDAPYYALQVEL